MKIEQLIIPYSLSITLLNWDKEGSCMVRFLICINTVFHQKNRQLGILFFTITIFMLSSFFVANYAKADLTESTIKKKKFLIVYYSRSGNTDYVAKHIHNQIGGDIVKLETVNPYPEQYRATTIQAKKELEADFRPALKNKINNIADYDVIFIGSPNWWGTMSMPIRTFLYDYDLSGKQVALFITHEGSGLGRSMDDLRKFEPNAVILDGIAIRGGSAEGSQSQVQQWLKKIGMVK